MISTFEKEKKRCLKLQQKSYVPKKQFKITMPAFQQKTVTQESWRVSCLRMQFNSFHLIYAATQNWAKINFENDALGSFDTINKEELKYDLKHCS